MSGKRIILGSLALNAILIVTAAYLWRHPPSAEPVAPQIVAPASPSSKPDTKPMTTRRSVATVNAPAPTVETIDWYAVESDDYNTYMTNLAALGLPDRAVAAIIKAEIDHRFDEQFAALQPSGEFKYWVSGEEQWTAVMPTGDQMRQREEILTAKRQLIRDLLGEEYAAEVSDPLMSLGRLQRGMLNFLPTEKQDALATLERQMQADLRERLSDIDGEGGAQSYLQMQRDLEKSASEFLTTVEFEEYQLRTSRTANQMRAEMMGFDATPEEFRLIFRIRKPIDDAELTMSSNEEMQAARQQMDSEIHGALGDYRYREYKRSQDPTFQMITRSGRATKASKESVVAVYEVANDLIQESKRIYRDQGLDDDEKKAARRALRSKAEAAIRDHFGYEALEDQRRGSFYWLKQIAPDEDG